jgi:Fe-S oxidoreductase
MKLEDATGYVAQCFNGEPASCSFACPFSLDIRAFLEKISKGRWTPAYKQLRNAVVFPSVVAALCPQPCRDHCQRAQLGDAPLALGDLEEACINYVKNRKAELFVIPPKTQKIAVVGAGPAGLSCALSLAQKKYIVTVFDKEQAWGGSLQSHPRFGDFDEDFRLQFSSVEVEFLFDTKINSLGLLTGYDAVYVATGKGGEDFGLLPGWDGRLLTTDIPNVFLGGELTGAPLMEAIAQGSEASKLIEGFLLAGKAGASPAPDRKNCERYLRHDRAENKPLVEKSNGESYTEEEAKAEAARCFQCDCDYCEASCEMLKWYRKKPHKLGMEVFTDAIANSLVSTRTLTRETYSCNICGKCKSVCPVDVDIGALLQYSRADRVGQDKQVPAIHDYWLRDMDFNATEGAFASAPIGKQTCDIAFFPGCKLGASNPLHVLKTYDYLENNYGAGILLNCCGAPAYWAGEEKRLDAHLEEIRRDWTRLGQPKLVFACATCEKMFRLFLPEIEQVSLYKLLAEDETLIPSRPFPEATVFDPCAARDDREMEQSVRTLAIRSGAALEELRDPNRCCGFGGHMRLANPELYDQITAHRAEAGDKPYLVYCANCKEVFRLQDKPVAHVLDTVYSLDPASPVPSLQEKRENTLEVKRTMMKTLNGTDFIPDTNAWDDMELVLGDSLLSELDRKLILSGDLKETIWRAETSGDFFVSEPDGVRQCCMTGPALTYWVRYKLIAPGKYEIRDAWTHRMHFSKED